MHAPAFTHARLPSATGRGQDGRLRCEPAEVTVRDVAPGDVVTVSTTVRCDGPATPAGTPRVLGPDEVPLLVEHATPVAGGHHIGVRLDTRRLRARRRLGLRLVITWADQRTALSVNLVTAELQDWADPDAAPASSSALKPPAHGGAGWPWRGRSRSTLLAYATAGGFVVPLLVVAWALGRFEPVSGHPFAKLLTPPAAAPALIPVAVALALATVWALAATAGLRRLHATDAVSRSLAATAVVVGLAARWVALGVGALAVGLLVVGVVAAAVTVALSVAVGVLLSAGAVLLALRMIGG